MLFLRGNKGIGWGIVAPPAFLILIGVIIIFTVLFSISGTKSIDIGSIVKNTNYKNLSSFLSSKINVDGQEMDMVDLLSLWYMDKEKYYLQLDSRVYNDFLMKLPPVTATLKSTGGELFRSGWNMVIFEPGGRELRSIKTYPGEVWEERRMYSDVILFTGNTLRIKLYLGGSGFYQHE